MKIEHLWGKIYSRLVAKRAISQSLILTSFLITFFIVRAITHLQRANIIPNQKGSFHIHHMVPGIILLLLSGFVGISFWSNEKLRHLTAIAFGVGAALTIDEFALWLFLKDVYWEKQGRDSIDAIVITGTLILISLLFTEINIIKHLWGKTTKPSEN